ncbi:hypothetical protein OKW22_000409 [Bacilli bacterium PM5-3]|nr:hypothetical protein [Bacilli bacterium PM5-3]MDH6603072.1 hypothetical protein [Bacilli bacterium PM5-9]
MFVNNLKIKFYTYIQYIKQNFMYTFAIFLIIFIVVYVMFIATLNMEYKITSSSVLISLLGILVVNQQNNKNQKTDIIIKKAQFTNEFIFKFKEHMPNMYWNSFHSENMIITDKLVELKKRVSKTEMRLCDIESFKDILGELKLTYDDIYKAHSDYFGDFEKIKKHLFTKPRLSESVNYNVHYQKHMEPLYNMPTIDEIDSLNEIDKKKLQSYRNEIINNILSASKEIYADTFNDLECISHFVMFNLIDLEKITDLIYNPFNYFVKQNYIFLMASILKGIDSGNNLYSNIALLDKKIKIEKDKRNFKKNKINNKLQRNKIKHNKEIQKINQERGDTIC